MQTNTQYNHKRNKKVESSDQNGCYYKKIA